MKTFIRSLSLGLVVATAGVWSVNVARGDEAAATEEPAVAPAAAPEAAAPAAEKPKSEFVGNWKVADGKGVVFYIILKDNGAAGSVWLGKDDQDRNESGRWKEIDNGVEISWNNGWHEVIVKVGENYVKRGYAPKLETGGEPSNKSSAEKVDAIPPSE